ncbi:hypothetical protein J4573_02485 [Actinomadura barringtoniae]|uniref:Uncharacterized protein n=1 Tax=Actinomadura barringtoniae TaxID=1427535 RepID=A0A939P5X5_9ACTN|nr:hypothetical protein [Actinomadura barringtoniae]MBO2445947.1 hypothetical protein [Actinomadura barringtoniae]
MGSKTLTASVTMGDAATDVARVFPKVLDALVKQVFCGGPTQQAQPAD